MKKQTRKEQLIQMIKEELDDIEKALIDTPDSVTDEDYQMLIERAKMLKETLMKIK